jgi:hypothetical protein
MKTTRFTAPADKLLTAAQMAAKLARTEAARDARAAMRCKVAAETGADPFSPAVKAEAARRLRAA